MTNPVHMVLLVLLCVWSSLLICGHSSMAEPLGLPELPMPGAQFGKVYRRMLGNNTTTLDPAFLTDVYGRAVVSQIFDGLVQFDAHLRPLPAIAKFWEASQDRRTWILTLRRGVRRHHGREVTARDFVYSFTRFLRVESPTPVADFFEHIHAAKEFIRGQIPHLDGLKAMDRYALQLVLEKPLP